MQRTRGTTTFPHPGPPPLFILTVSKGTIILVIVGVRVPRVEPVLALVERFLLPAHCLCHGARIMRAARPAPGGWPSVCAEVDVLVLGVSHWRPTRRPGG
jgi:hypothetical protein